MKQYMKNKVYIARNLQLILKDRLGTAYTSGEYAYGQITMVLCMMLTTLLGGKGLQKRYWRKTNEIT